MSAQCETSTDARSDDVTAASIDDVMANVKFMLECVTTGIFCLSGFVGNLMCLAALCQDRIRNSNTHLLSALAVFDWLMLLSLFTCVALPEYCRYFSTCDTYLATLRRTGVASTIWVAACMVQTASIWMVVAVTVDRFTAVCLPLQFRTTSARRRSNILISFVVALSILFNLPRFFHHLPLTSAAAASEHLSETHPNNSSVNTSLILVGENISKSCASETLEQEENIILVSQTIWYNYVYYISLSWLVFYIIPIISLVVLNILLIHHIRRAQRRRAELAVAYVSRGRCSNSNNVGNNTGNRAARGTSRDNLSLTVNIVAMVTVFIICQTPDFVLTLISYRGFTTNAHLLKVLRGLCYCLLALNSSVNFLIYCLFYRRFRAIVTRMICLRPLRKLLRMQHGGGERSGDLSELSTLTKQTVARRMSTPVLESDIKEEKWRNRNNEVGRHLMEMETINIE